MAGYPPSGPFGGPVPIEVPGAGFGFPGFGGGLNLDLGGGIGGGFPGLGALSGIPGFAGPYVPVTPLGALGGIKGDLIVPMVAVGVAIFLLVLIVLAVKAALMWKLRLVEDVAGGPRRLRDVDNSAPTPELGFDNLAHYTKMVYLALDSEGCSKRMLCEIATMSPQIPLVLRMMEPFVPTEYIPSLEMMKQAGEGNFECKKKFLCSGDSLGQGNKNSTMQEDSNSSQKDDKEINKDKKLGQSEQNQVPSPMQLTSPRPTLLDGIQIKNQSDAVLTNEIRPNVPSRPTKFRRGVR